MKGKVLLVQDVAESGKKLLWEDGFEVVIAPDENKSTIKTLIKDSDAVFSKTVFLDEEILKTGKKLKVVGKHGVGIDNVVDVETATRLGIFVVNTPLANILPVAEHTIAALLSLAKNAAEMDYAVRNNGFNARDRVKSVEVSGKTLGVIGLGNIGMIVAKKAFYGLDMKVICYDPYLSRESVPEFVKTADDADKVFKNADFLSLHINASPKTAGFVNKEKLQLMKPGAYLLNFSRGAVVKEQDLIDALRKGIIRGAALDVFEKEPPESDNPLLKMKNVLLSPHCAAITAEAEDRTSYDGCKGIADILNGNTPQWCVNYAEVKAKA